MKFLIIGGGSIGQRHIKNLKQLGDHQVWVLKRKKDPDFAEKFGVTVIDSLDEARQLSLDGAFICTPTSLHTEGLKWAAQKGLHVFMEKPLIHDRPGLEIARQTLEGFDRTFFIGFMLRYHPLVRSIKTFLEDEILGHAYAARFEFGSYLPFWHPWEDYRISYAARRELGGGVINTITHELDLIQYFFGSPQAVTCEARNLGKLGVDVEEVCDAIFTYPDKAVSLHLNYLQKDYDRNIKILCDEGEIRWDWHGSKVEIRKHGEDLEVISMDTFEVNTLYLDELHHFLTLVEANETEHALDARHALRNTELMLAMHESSRVGQKIPV